MTESPMTDAAAETDDELLLRMRSGDEQAFVALYRRRQAAIYRFALHMSGSAAVAEDIIQEVFLALIRDDCGYDPERGTLSGYLFGIARKLALRQIARRRTDVAIEGGPTIRLCPSWRPARINWPTSRGKRGWRHCAARCRRCRRAIGRWSRCATWRKWITRRPLLYWAARSARCVRACIARAPCCLEKMRQERGAKPLGALKPVRCEI